MKKYLLFFLLFFLIAFNCEKDDKIVSPNTEPTLTQAEIIAEKLQAYIDDNHPVLAEAFRFDYEVNEWVNDNNGRSCNGYKIESPFIQVCGVHYNLEYLVKYEPGATLKLYFLY